MALQFRGFETGLGVSGCPAHFFDGDRGGCSLRLSRLEFRLQAARGILQTEPRKRGTPNESPARFEGSVKLRLFALLRLEPSASRRQQIASRRQCRSSVAGKVVSLCRPSRGTVDLRRAGIILPSP